MSLMPKRGSSARCPQCRAKVGQPCNFLGREVPTHLRRVMREVVVSQNELYGRVSCDGERFGCEYFVPEPGGYCDVCKEKLDVQGS